MKIDGIQKVEQLYKTTPVQKPQNLPSERQDRVEISKEAKDLYLADRISEDRIAKIEELKERINSGKYKVDAEQVAKKIASYYNM